MRMSGAAEANLLFGLLALQIGLVDQSRLVAAFQAWTLDKSRGLADHLVARGDLDSEDHAAVAALVQRHLKKHGHDIERSLAAVPVGPSTRAQLARLGDSDLDATLEHVVSAPTEDDVDADRTASFAVGTATSEGQRFRVLRPHASGGLGAVFVALDTELHREVALKQINDSHADDPASRARFLLEAEITGRLEHPGIVPVYGLGVHPDGRPYYAMRFIRGDSLKEAIERFHSDSPLPMGEGGRRPGEGSSRDPGRRSLELRKLLRRFMDVCNAIDYAHARGVLHRDIKPGNIIVGRHGETLVVDWGLAKATGKSDPAAGERTLAPSSKSGSAATLPGSALGTPGYMSPEQAEGDLPHMGPHSDVYSLGATLYCVLTGRPPFTGELADVLRAAQRGEFPPPRQIDPTIDGALEAICKKAMALHAAERYTSCRALAEEIERWMADEPVTAWREPMTRRARRWIGRHRTAVTAAAVALVAGVLALATVAGVQAQANVALRKANKATNDALAQTQEAQTQTQKALNESEESRRQAEAVSNFLVEAFRSPDPAQTGRDVKVADLLDRASGRLDRDFGGSPLTQAALLNALGSTYHGLGLYEKAMSLHARAGAGYESALGSNHLDTLAARYNLANDYWEAGRISQAIALHETTLKLFEATLGPDHPRTLASRNSLSSGYYSAGRFAEAIALDTVTLKLREAKLGADHPDTLISRNNLALDYFSAGRIAEGIALHKVTVKLCEAKLGLDHPDTLSSRDNLANFYSTAGDLTEAIGLRTATIEIQKTKLGADHPDTLRSRLNLGIDFYNAGRRWEAIALLEETLGPQQLKLGPDHSETLLTRSSLANAYREAGRLPGAIALHEGTLKLYESKLGPDHPDTLACRRGLAAVYEALARFSEAEDLYRGTLARRRKAGEPDSPFLANDLAALGHHLLGQSRWAESEPLLREARAIRERAAPDTWERFDAMSMLGGALLGQGRFAEAEPLLIDGYQGMKAREARIYVPDRTSLSEAAERVTRLYEAWHKPGPATQWKAKLGMSDLPVDVFVRP
jgi:serine/threonine protein kinase/tetratricopeptide (TPR) repeat protein